MNQNEILELKAIIGGGAGDNLSKGLLPISRSTWYRGIIGRDMRVPYD